MPIYMVYVYRSMHVCKHACMTVGHSINYECVIVCLSVFTCASVYHSACRPSRIASQFIMCALFSQYSIYCPARRSCGAIGGDLAPSLGGQEKISQTEISE